MRLAQPPLYPFSIALYLVAVAVRLGFVWSTRQEPILTTFLPDLDDAVTWEAARLLGDGVSDAPAFERKMLSAPLKVYTLAIGQWVLGPSVVHHRVASVLLHSLRFPLLLMVACRLTQRRAASVVAVGLVALLPTCVFADSTIGKSALELSLLTLLVFFVTSSIAERWLARLPMAVLVGAISGVLLAACFFCQMLSLGYAVPVAGALLLSGRPSQRRPWPALIALTCVLGVCLAVWNLRPKDAYTGLFLPRAGIDLAIAVGTDDGTYKPQRDVPANLVGHAFESRFLAEREMHAALTPIEADRHHRAGAVRVPQEQGTVVLGRVWQKFKLFARGYEVPTELDPVYFVGRVVPVGIAPSFSLLLGLAVLGLWASRHAAPGFVVLLSGLLLVVLAMNLIGFVSWRYRLPAVIPCCLLAAHGLGMIGRACRRSIRVGAFVSLLAICAYGAVKPGEALMRRAENRLRANLRAASQHAGDIRALSGVRSPRDRVVGLARAHLHTAAFQAWLALPPGERNFDTDRIALRYLLWLGAYDAAASIVRALPPEVRDIAIYDGSAARGYVLVSLLGLGSPG